MNTAQPGLADGGGLADQLPVAPPPQNVPPAQNQTASGSGNGGLVSGLPTPHDGVSSPVPLVAPSGSVAKEQVERGGLTDLSERVPIVETREPETVPEEVEGWLEKLEQGEDIKLSQPVTDDSGQTVVSPAAPSIAEEKIVLPMSQEGIQKGIHVKIYSSARWLAEWCLRLIKKFPGEVLFRQVS